MELHTQIPQLKVKDLLDEGAASLDLRLLAGEAGLTTAIAAPTIQKPGLALAGFFEYLHPGRVQILGRSEVEFLDGLPEERRRQVIAQLASSDPACFVVTRSLPAPAALHEEADRRGIALLGTDRLSGEAIEEFHRFLEERLAPFSSLHGVLVDVYGLGVLLLGESGVGKSECALDLIVRGHRLVADDIVLVRRIGAHVEGSGVELTRYHMEVRGLGIINVKELFGIASVRQRKYVEVIVTLELWKEGVVYERLGLDEKRDDILGLSLPSMTIPVAPGRNISVLIEVASRHELMKLRGYNPAQELERRMRERMAPEPTESEPGTGRER